MSDVVVTDNPQESRWEAHLDGELAGFAEYKLTDELVVFVHTEVFERFEGKGIAGSIVRTSLDAVRAAGERKVMPLCPFYKAWLQRHPDYQDLVHGV